MKKLHTNSLTLLASLLATAGYAQIAAVDYGANYRASGDVRPDGSTITFNLVENGNFDGQGDATDRRGYWAPEGRTLNITSTTVPPVDPLVKNTVLNYGYQMVALDTNVNPVIVDLRLAGDTNPDVFRVRSGITPADVTLSFLPNVPKAQFLNGFNASTNVLSFSNTNSFTIKLASNGNLASGFARAAVKNGSQWYVSGTKTSATTALTINPFTENWYPLNPDVNMYIFETDGLPSGTPVAGSAISNIVAIGIYAQAGAATGGSYAGSTANLLRLDVHSFTVTDLVASPAPANPLAVKFGGDYANNDVNTDKGGLVTETGDFDFDGSADDLRSIIPFGTAFAVGNNSGPDDLTADTASFKNGFQQTYVGYTNAAPAFTGVYRYFGAQAPDRLQVGHGPVTNAATEGMIMTFVPYVEKANFRNGLDDPMQGLAFVSTNDSINMLATKQGPGANDWVTHAVVQNGNSWYISATSSTANNALSFNGATETWYPYNPEANLVIPAFAGGVLGSTFDNIQAVGVLGQDTVPAGDALNANIIRVEVVEALLELSGLVVPSTASIDVPRFDTPPTIDGVVNASEWAGAASYEMKWPELGAFPNIGGLKYAAPSHEDLSATVYYAWDANFLYFGMVINDDVVYDGDAKAFDLPDDDDHILWGVSPFAPANAAAGSTDWSVGNVFATELGMDTNNVVYQSIPGGSYNGGSAFSTPNSTFTGSNVSSNKWGFEVALAWDDLLKTNNFVPASNDKFGQHMLIVDADTTLDGSGYSLRETFLYSAGGNDGSVAVPSGWNELVLVEALGLPADYDEWIAKYDVGGQTALTDDFDLDGMDHLLEYALGGNPETNDVVTVMPAAMIGKSGASNVFAYVYNRWKDAASRGLTYTVQRETDLVYTPESWTTNGIGEITGPSDAVGFETVTNTVPADVGKRFMRLQVELAE